MTENLQKQVSIFSRETLIPISFVILLLGMIVTANNRMSENAFSTDANAQSIVRIDDRVGDLENRYFDSLLEISQRLESIETTLKIDTSL